MTEALPPPTAEVRRLVQCMGAEGALKLVEARGGTRIYVPKKPTPDFVELVGEAAARGICEALGGQFIKVPMARAWRVLIYSGRGMSYSQTARAAGCTEDAVWRILSRHDRTAKQFDLFV